MLRSELLFVCLNLCLLFYQLSCAPDKNSVADDINSGLDAVSPDYPENASPHSHSMEDMESSTELIDTFADTYNPVNDMFPDVKGDLTLITWKHAVNSKAKLEAALNSTAKMLEADVIIGTLVDDPTNTPLAVMGHPPQIESDISLEQFIAKVVESGTNKGIKLDFKSDEAFLKAKDVLENVDSSGGIPIWLNADILPGPVNATDIKPVSADLFLNISLEYFPVDMLSVGWTTHYAPNGKYTSEQIEAMTAALNRNKILSAVTFPVRAVFATECVDLLHYLVNTSPAGSSLTVWMSNDADPVNIPKLKHLLSTIGKNKVFLDVPDFIRERLNSTTDDSNPNRSCSMSGNVLLTTLVVFLLGAVYFH